jgi:serine/threonine-protein kinase HipA
VSVDIAVYADWEGLPAPVRLGWLYAQRAAGRELFEFEFEADTLERADLGKIHLDPRLGHFPGRQHPPHASELFGVFMDSSPDRWGRLLMKRRLEREQRAGIAPKNQRLHESDYLLGVHDQFRIGALRFRLNDAGEFLDDKHGVAAPPFIQLRELEAAVRNLEKDEDNTAPGGNDWLLLLLAPGGSLGGARPKASIVDPQNRLWIAKFPSTRDEHDVGAWELIAHTLARACGIRVPDSLARRFASPHHTFLVRRFDRTEAGRRLHFASAMTLTSHSDGDDASTGASYLELAEVLIQHGARTADDLRELWSRIVFNMMVSNTDDHLRNHGFILEPDRGWRLSEAYDINPVPNERGLRLNVSEADNALDLDLARSVAHYYRLKPKDANDIIERISKAVSQWRTLAATLSIPAREQEQMSSAFRLAG